MLVSLVHGLDSELSISSTISEVKLTPLQRHCKFLLVASKISIIFLALSGRIICDGNGIILLLLDLLLFLKLDQALISIVPSGQVVVEVFR